VFVLTRYGHDPIQMEHRPIIVIVPKAAKDAPPPGHGLHDWHGYVVRKVENGQVWLHNPWGYEHPDVMTVRQFLDSVDDLIVTLGALP
jgi:hypothetical protein